MTGLRIVLAGDEAAGRRAMSLIERSSHDLVGVAARANGQLFEQATVSGVPTFNSRSLAEPAIAQDLAALAPDVLLNIHSLTKVCSEVLNTFPTGAWNLHPGALPEAAGINVPSWAIALGWKEHGVSLHWMTPDYDAGHIAYEDRFPIKASATGLTLSAECASRGLRLVANLLDQLAVDPAAVPRVPQDFAQRRYFGQGQPNAGQVDWKDSAEAIEAHVRAADFRPFPSPWATPTATIDGELFELVEVQVGSEATAPPGTQNESPSGVSVAAADRWINVIDARKALTP